MAFITEVIRVLAGILCCLALQLFAATKISVVKIDGQEITGIRDAHLGADGRVIILFQGGGTTAAVDKLPTDFLESWNIKADAAVKKQQKYSQESLEKAIASGMFREVDGVVYDLRKPQSEWVTLVNVKIFQIISDGALAQPESSNPYSPTVIFIRNLPPTVADTDRVTITAKVTDNFSYVSKAYLERTVRAYDMGKACNRSQIPPEMLAKNLAACRSLIDGGAPPKNSLASLPQSHDLTASGTGFFITDDGYLVTNFHVVEGATSFKLKTKNGTFPAQLVRSDRSRDLALLKASGNFKPLRLSDQDEATLGEEVFTIGFPNIDLQGVEPKYTDGKISSLFGLHDDPARYQISVPVQPGNSGGPLVDRSGAVVGIVVSRLNDLAILRAAGSLPQNVNYAIKLKLLRELLKQESEVHLPKDSSAPAADNVINAAQESVALVLVY